MITPANWTMEQGAYDVIRTTQPSLIMTLTGLLLRGQTPKQITDFIGRRDVFLAAIVEMALPIIQEKITKSVKTTKPDPCGEEDTKEGKI
jgi:hypothetical protein